MDASSIEALRALLEAEAGRLAVRRDELREQLAEVERQLRARHVVVENLALIRPLPFLTDSARPFGTAGTREPAAPRKPGARKPAGHVPGAGRGRPAGKPARTRPAGPAGTKPAGPKTDQGRPDHVNGATPGHRARTGLRKEIAALLATSAGGLATAGRAIKAGRGLFSATTG